MIYKRYKYLIVVLIIAMFSFTKLYAQQGTVEINQDNQIDVLLKVKKDVNASESNYKIQIYSGNRSGAEKAQLEFRNWFNEWPSTKEFETPNYKIWVGNFETRLEADRALLKIKQKFPNAFYFKPKKDWD
jgi:hypothetical protein